MAKALVVEKHMPLALLDIIKFQIMLHCFSKKIRMSPAQQDCLALLGLYGEIHLADFCEQVVNEDIFGNVQTARNFITKYIKEGLVIRSGLGNKVVSLNPNFNFITSGTIVINLKAFHHDTN